MYARARAVFIDNRRNRVPVIESGVSDNKHSEPFTFAITNAEYAVANETRNVNGGRRRRVPNRASSRESTPLWKIRLHNTRR